MNNAALKGIAMTWADYQNAAAYEETRCTITKTANGWEARRGGKLVGVTQTREGAKELLGAF